MSGGVDVLRVAAHVRVAADPDGAVLLDLRTGRYLAVNPVGSAVIEGVRAGWSTDDIVRDLTATSTASAERVEQDAARFVSSLIDAGIMERVDPTDRPPATVRPGSRPADQDRAGEPWPQHGSGTGSWIGLLSAYVCLVLVDLALRLLGFGRVHRMLAHVPRGRRELNPAKVRRLVATLDRAAAAYVRPVLCLQRSVAAVIALRCCRWPADLVLGVKRRPFAAHAWVELNGQVVNDDQRVQRYYALLDRC